MFNNVGNLFSFSWLLVLILLELDLFNDDGLHSRISFSILFLFLSVSWLLYLKSQPSCLAACSVSVILKRLSKGWVLTFIYYSYLFSQSFFSRILLEEEENIYLLDFLFHNQTKFFSQLLCVKTNERKRKTNLLSILGVSLLFLSFFLPPISLLSLLSLSVSLAWSGSSEYSSASPSFWFDFIHVLFQITHWHTHTHINTAIGVFSFCHYACLCFLFF